MGAWGTGTATIPNGGQFTGVIDLGETGHFLALRLPAAMTGTSFAVWAFGAPGASGDGSQALQDAIAALGAGPGTFQQVFDDSGAPLTITFAQGTCVGVGPSVMSRLTGFRFIALKSGAVAEGGVRSIGYCTKA